MSKHRIFISAASLGLVVLFSNCHKDIPNVDARNDSPMVPALPATVDDYPASKNDYMAALGRVFFYDKELSANKNISCGSCHQQAHAFTDGKQFSQGTNSEHAKRNTPQIFFRTGKFFWDGRANSMQDMVMRPVTDDREMDVNNTTMLMERLNTIDYYKPLMEHAYFMPKDIDSNVIKQAVAEFMKNIAFNKNKFNANAKKEANFTPEEQTGKDLFFGTAGCANCHRLTPNAGNEYYSTFAQSHNIGLDVDNKDKGVGAVTRMAKDEGAFITPVLMNVEFTAPYMHDGRFKTLEEVVEHYNSGVKANPNLDPLLQDFGKPKKLNLTDSQKSALVAFLKTLSDHDVLTDAKYSDPFVPRAH